jgi:hypothetical protein
VAKREIVMSRIIVLLAAVATGAVLTFAVPAVAKPKADGFRNAQLTDVSAARRHYYYRHYGFYPRFYPRYYYGPSFYYGYSYGYPYAYPYYYRPYRYYYRAPWPFWPWW